MSLDLDTSPLDRVRAALLSHADHIVPTTELLHAAFGPILPQGSIVKLNQIISGLRAEDEPIERTKWGFRLVLACETDGLWASSGFVSALRDRAVVQGDLFGEVVP